MTRATLTISPSFGLRISARRGRPRGVGLIELLVALAISAALLTAVAVATDASYRAYAINVEQSSLLQNGRLAMNRMLTYIRQNKAHQPFTSALVASFAAGTTVTDTGISMLTDTGVQVDFKYDSANQRVLMVQAGVSREMLRGVTSFQVKLEPMRSAASLKSGSGYDLLRRATILLTVQSKGSLADIDEAANGQTVTLSASVMPRRNAW